MILLVKNNVLNTCIRKKILGTISFNGSIFIEKYSTCISHILMMKQASSSIVCVTNNGDLTSQSLLQFWLNPLFLFFKSQCRIQSSKSLIQ
ncbi:hypothetical protein Bca4012_025868 [Brassica carinata]